MAGHVHNEATIMTFPISTDPTQHVIADLSRWNPVPDAAHAESMVEDGVEGVVLRLFVGDYYTDATYAPLYKFFKDLGVPVGAYGVTRPGISVARHVQRALMSLDNLPEPDMWVSDAELKKTSGGRVVSVREQRDLQGGVVEWMEQRQKPVSIYTRATWWDQYVGLVDWAKKYYAWMAHYYWPWVQNPYVAVGWDDWDCWQLGDKFVMDGVVGNTVDLNFMKDQMFQAFKGVAVEPDPDPVEKPTILQPGLYRVP